MVTERRQTRASLDLPSQGFQPSSESRGPHNAVLPELQWDRIGDRTPGWGQGWRNLIRSMSQKCHGGPSGGIRSTEKAHILITRASARNTQLPPPMHLATWVNCHLCHHMIPTLSCCGRVHAFP